MAVFIDVNGRTWVVELDGPLMREVRDKAKVDLADLSGNGYLQIEQDAPSLVDALKILCREQITAAGLTPEVFAKAIRKDALTHAAAAIIEAASFFFPDKTWSSMLSLMTTSRTMKEQFRDLIPMLSALEDPHMPSMMKDVVMSAIATKLEELGKGNTDSAALAAALSAIGPVETRSSVVTDSPASAASVPAA